ncbi:MAG: antibiotic biosynthesis monooxygenase [Desulfobacteraceae bacterium]
MTVKILLERKFKEEPTLEEIKIINELRIGAMHQPGYVGGETLVDLDDYRKIVVISVWSNKAAWEKWKKSDQRQKLEANLNENLKQRPIIRSFMLGADYLGDVFEEVVHDSEVK